jgi:hypothetical protein
MTQPLRLDDTWAMHEATLLGAEAEALFAPFAQHTELADCVIVHRDGADKVVMLGWPFWLRVLATVAEANDYPLPDKAARR